MHDTKLHTKQKETNQSFTLQRPSCITKEVDVTTFCDDPKCENCVRRKKDFKSWYDNKDKLFQQSLRSLSFPYTKARKLVEGYYKKTMNVDNLEEVSEFIVKEKIDIVIISKDQERKWYTDKNECLPKSKDLGVYFKEFNQDIELIVLDVDLPLKMGRSIL